MSKYVASIFTDWEDYTDRHKVIRECIESKVSDFIDGKKVNPLAIRGAIGQGKTQLLYHAFRFAWNKGCVVFYTTLDKLIPEQEMSSSEFAEYIDSLIDENIKMLNSGVIDKTTFLTEDMKDYLRKTGTTKPTLNKAVILIDEMERSYKHLLNQVRADDRSPFGYWLEHTHNLPIGAFAPLSHYEVLYGEAERRRWEPLMLSPITPSVLREKEGDLGNFIWWVSRGRLGISYKARDVITKSELNNYKDIEELTRTLGSVAEVQAIDLDALAKASNSIKYITELFPHESLSLPHLIEGNVVNRAEIIRVLKEALRNEQWEDRIVEFFCHYFDIVADAVSRNGEFLVPTSHEEFKALFNVSVDMSIESETSENEDVRKILERVKTLEGQEHFPSFFYLMVLHKLQNISRKGSILSYKEIVSLFPMPVTSPNFGGIPTGQSREIVLSKSRYSYAAKDEISNSKGTITYLYFANETKLKDYLDSDAIMDHLTPKFGLVCILLSGDHSQVKISEVARWLQSNGRLRVETPPKILSDFLACFMAWAFENGVADGFVDNFTGLLRQQAEELSATKKDLSRKASHYAGMLDTFSRLSAESLSLQVERYTAKVSQDFIRKYGTRYKRFEDIVGLAFVEDKNSRVLVYRLRKILQDSEELKGLRSGISSMIIDVSVTAKKELSGALQSIQTDFEPYLLELKSLAPNVDEDNFARLSEQAEGKQVLVGIHRYIRSSIQPSTIATVKRDIDDIVKDIQKLVDGRMNVINTLGIDLRQSLSEKNQDQFNELISILDDSDDVSPYIQNMLVKFAEVIAGDFKDQYLQPNQTTLTEWSSKLSIAQEFRRQMEQVDDLSKELLDWLGYSRDNMKSEFETNYKSALARLTIYEHQVDWDDINRLEWASYEEDINKLTDLIEKLVQLDLDLKEALRLANEASNKIKGE